MSHAAMADLRAHQEEAVSAVLAEFQIASRAQVTMPCGTGKTLVGIACAVRSGARLVLLVVPTLELVHQSARAWTSAIPQLRLLIACSEHVASVNSEFRASTDPAHLAAHLARQSSGMKAILTTYASLPRVAAAVALAGAVIDLAIGDEAHHCAGPWSAPSSLLAREGMTLPVRKRLFMTATRRIDPDADPRTSASMDDEAAFGRQAYFLPLRSAIQRGLLSDYQIAIVAVTAREWSWLASRHGHGAAAGRRAAPRVSFAAHPGLTSLSARSLAAVFALGQNMATSGTRRVLTFHNRISEARSFALAAPLLLRRDPRAPACDAHVVHGGLSAAQRRSVLAKLDHADTHGAVVLSNVRCLAEGVDLPALDAVVFAATRTSTVDIVQALGRVLRRHPDKVMGTVILPVLVRDGVEATDRLVSSSYADAFRVLNVLREHDSELAAGLDSARRRRGRRRRAKTTVADLGPLRIQLPEGLSESFIQGFQLEVLRATTSTWQERFGALERWIEDHGSADVPIGAVVDGGVRLGAWVHQQRTSYKARCLSVIRVRQLESLPGWSWSSWDASWNRAFGLVSEHAALTEGRPIAQTTVIGGVKIGQWVKAQREKYHRGQLDAERARRLESVPGWVWRLRTPVRAPADREPRRVSITEYVA